MIGPDCFIFIRTQLYMRNTMVRFNSLKVAAPAVLALFLVGCASGVKTRRAFP